MNENKGFYGLGIAPAILAVLDKLNFTIPTPIQEKSIPVAAEGKDMVGIAQTGTGKTLAFGIPMIQAVLQGKGRGLVILPTRELAIQVQETFQKVGGPLGVRSAIAIGGESIDRQIREFRREPQIVIGTPGRIIDHLRQRTLNLSRVRVLVLDEADRMLDMGFAPQLKQIMESVPKTRQTMLFSATMPDEILRLARGYMELPVRVEIAPSGTAIEKVSQELFFVSRDEKPRLLEKVLSEYRGSILVFARTKFGVKKITRSVRAMGHSAAELHSNRSLGQRREALEGFRNGRYRVLVATDIAARGIDVKGIELVVNYDLPQAAEDYVHRIGRTGRAGMTGHAIAFATPDQRGDVKGIERLMRMTLPTSQPGELPPRRYVEQEPVRPAYPSRPSRPSFGSRPARPAFGTRPFRSASASPARPSRPSFGRSPAPRSGYPERSAPARPFRGPQSGFRSSAQSAPGRRPAAPGAPRPFRRLSRPFRRPGGRRFEK